MADAAATQDLALGVDLGTSAVKVLLIDAQGAVSAEAQAGFDTIDALPRQAEQEPADWLAACSHAMRAIGAPAETALGPAWRERIGAIGLTGQLPTLVCLGERDPLAPAITWRDGRADEFAARRLDARARRHQYERTGMPIDGRYLAPMLQYHFADRIDAVRCLLSAKDYLLFALTGLRATEPSTAAGYGLYDLSERRFSPQLAAFWGIALEQLPPILPSNSIAAPLSAKGARLLHLPVGIPVTTGAADSVCAAFAMSGLDPQAASISLGSSAVVIGAADTPGLDAQSRFLVTPHVRPGWYAREMDLLATGTGHRWLSGLFGWTPGELDLRAAASSAGAGGLVFPPYLAGGEQGALWNPHLRAGMFGLGLHHTQNDVARAFLEGVCFELRRCLEVLAEHGELRKVMVSGDITRSRTSLQLLADILKLPVTTVTLKSPAAYGAALLSSRTASLRAEQRSEINPSALATASYDELYRRYCAAALQCA